MMCIEASERDGAFAVLEGVEGVHTNVLIGLMSVVRLCTPEAAEKGALCELDSPYAQRLYLSFPLILV